MNRSPARWAPALLTCAAMLACATTVRANITIVPTFDSTISGSANAVAIEGAINAAIAVLEADIATPITVNIYFQSTNSGLGGSNTGLYGQTYFQYYNALQAIDNAAGASAAQHTAFASLGAAPVGPTSVNPVNGTTNVYLTSANSRALGFSAPPAITVGGVDYDSVISLNTSITSPPNGLPGFYGLQSVAAHEIDETLGIGGTGSMLGAGFSGNPIGALDLYRYSAAGVRSFTTAASTSPTSYFSIDGGHTVLSYFNQSSGADYADWLSNPIPSGYAPQVQDAFGKPGTNPALGANELTALNVIGYNLVSAVPEPSRAGLLAAGLALLALRRRRRHRAG